MQFKFNTETIEKVKNNWLFKENQLEFSQCKTDSDFCLTFVRVSNMNDGSESSLVQDITNQVINQIKKQ
jgi:hypothetical protein